MNKNKLSPEIIELWDEYHNSITKSDYENCLSNIKSKNQINKQSLDYINLLHLECISRQRIYETGPCPIEKIIPNLNKALECVIEIQKICEILQDYPLWNLISMQEATCILTEISKFDDPVKYLNEIVKLHGLIRNNENVDKQLLYLSYMNEAKTRVDLAKNGINPKENCKLALKLSEKSREYYEIEFPDYNITFQNQVYALSLLSKSEPYGFEIEMKECFKKLNSKIDNKLNFFNLQIAVEQVELGIKDVEKLDEIYDNIKILKMNLYPEENVYKQTIIFEGELLIKKAEFSDDKCDKVGYLNQSIEYFKNHLDFNDNYYNVQSLFNIGYAKLQLSKLIQRKKNLKESMQYFLVCMEYYEETPFQDNDYFYPKVGFYLAKVAKEISLDDGDLIKKYKDIERTLLDCLKYFENNKNKEKILECYLELGDLFFKMKNYEKADYYLKNGIDLVEMMRASIFNPIIKKRFFEKANYLFKLMVLTCYELNNKGESLKYVELSKHRIFLDKITDNQRYNFIKPINKSLIYELDNINSKIQKILSKLKDLNKFEFKLSSNYEKLSKLKNQQEYYLDKIKNEYSEFYDYYYNHVFDYKKIDLTDKTLIEYYYSDDFLLIFLIENNKINIEKIDFEDNRLVKLISDFEKQLEYYDDIEKTEEILHELYNILIMPIKGEISNKNLIIIPYKRLHNIPFNCLKYNDKEYLIDEYVITIMQSGSSIKYIENNYSMPNNYLVVGNPTLDLPYAEKEALHISHILKTKPLIGNYATKSNILSKIEGKQIIHFSCHGEFDSQNPLHSMLKLNNGENLYLEDLNNLELNSELIVLSACESGIVSIDNNDETEGFVKYLQIDGTKYIIASLWRGYDESSFKLFEIFYSMDGDYSKRLNSAQIELKNSMDNDNKDHNIFYWGNFQIYGI